MPTFDWVLREAIGGDGRAFEQLYRVLNRRVHAFARARGAADPEGLVNEVFFQVFTGLGAFEGTEPQFKAWVFKIARNKVIDETRRRQRRPTEVAQNAEDRPRASTLAGTDDVEAEVIGRIGTESLLAHLDALTADQRDVVLLRVVSDLTVEAIAEILDRRPGAVKALQRRAFRTLARALVAQTVPV